MTDQDLNKLEVYSGLQVAAQRQLDADTHDKIKAGAEAIRTLSAKVAELENRQVTNYCPVCAEREQY